MFSMYVATKGPPTGPRRIRGHLQKLTKVDQARRYKRNERRRRDLKVWENRTIKREKPETPLAAIRRTGLNLKGKKARAQLEARIAEYMKSLPPKETGSTSTSSSTTATRRRKQHNRKKV